MKMPKSLDNLFNNIYFLYFVSFLAVFNVFAYIIMNNFNAIILFILVGYITYLFSKNMAIVLLVALLLTNLFMSSNNNRMGREGMTSETTVDGEPADEPADATGTTAGATSTTAGATSTTAGDMGVGSVTSTTPSASTAPSTATMATKKSTPQPKLATSTSPSPSPSPASATTGNLLGMQTMQQSYDLDKMQGLLNQSQKLIGDLKNAFPGMGNILGNLGQP